MKQKKSPNPHKAVSKAVKEGDLPRLDGSIRCVDCGEPAKNYDHRDYAKPLDVEPVCISCNLKRGPAANYHLCDQAASEYQRFTFWLPSGLIERLDQQAKTQRRSRSAQLSILLDETLPGKSNAEPAA